MCICTVEDCCQSRMNDTNIHHMPSLEIQSQQATSSILLIRRHVSLKRYQTRMSVSTHMHQGQTILHAWRLQILHNDPYIRSWVEIDKYVKKADFLRGWLKKKRPSIFPFDCREHNHLMSLSLGHAPSLCKVWHKLVLHFLYNLSDIQSNRVKT